MKQSIQDSRKGECFILIKSTFLNKFMDGQLGHDEDNSSVPKVIEQFKELGAPNSLSRERNANRQTTPLKVGYIHLGGLNQHLRRPTTI